MFYGITHVDVPVSDLARSQRFYSEVMELTLKKAGEGWVDLESGTVVMRLVQTERARRHVTLRVNVPDVDAAYRALLSAGARPLYEAIRTPELELMAQVVDFDNHEITVWRELTEDEYPSTPELPKELTWQPDAEELMKSLLKSVPVLFRALARKKVVREAETLAGPAAVVNKECVVRGYILANAKITRGRVREPLRKHGYDPEKYAADFLAD